MGHEVICAGKLTSRTQRPISAGLNGLQPKPPKVIFPTPMAKSAPIRIIQMGKLLGRFIPKSMPVRIALQSAIVLGRLSKNLVIAHSNNTQAETLVRQTTTLPKPKEKNDTARAGTKAMRTPYMFRSTLSLPWLCGDKDMIKFDMAEILLFCVAGFNDAHYCRFAQADVIKQSPV